MTLYTLSSPRDRPSSARGGSESSGRHTIGQERPQTARDYPRRDSSVTRRDSSVTRSHVPSAASNISKGDDPGGERQGRSSTRSHAPRPYLQR